jgi:hypothetical protein
MKSYGKQLSVLMAAALAAGSGFALSGKNVKIENGEGPGWVFKNCRLVEYGATTLHFTEQKGSFIEFSFVGTGIEVYAKTDPQCGSVDIFIDEVFQSAVDTSSAENIWKVKVFEKGSLSAGSHKIRIAQTGKHGIKLDYIQVFNDPAVVVGCSKRDDFAFHGVARLM